jgi:hypothetical protein
MVKIYLISGQYVNALLCAGEESKSSPLLKCPGTQSWREELLNSKWPHVNKEITLRKILTAKKATEEGNLGAHAYKVKRKWENQK